MKLSIHQATLSKHLDNAVKFINSKEMIPILSHILLTVTDEGLEIMAGGTESFIKSFIPAADLRQGVNGQAAVPGRKLAEVVKRMAGQLEIEAANNTVTLKAGKSVIELSTMDASEFPKFPPVEGQEVTLKGLDFRDMVNQTAYAVSTQESTPVLLGVLFSQSQGKLRLTACDRHRLAQAELDNESEDFTAIIDGITLSNLTKIVSDKEDVELTFGTGVIAKTPEFTFYSRTLDGTYPDTSKLIAREFKTRLRMNTAELRNALDLILVLARDNDSKTQLVKLTIDDQGLTIESNGQNQRASEFVDVKQFNGEGLKINVNGKFLSDALKVIEANETEINLVGGLNPIILRGVDELAFSLILPYRTSN
jgi:DNA polymerase-3 subunit beta